MLANGTVEPFALTTFMVSAPRTEFMNPTTRRFAQSVTTFQSLISHIVDEGGPVDYPPDPYAVPQPWPAVQKSAITIVAEPIST